MRQVTRVKDVSEFDLADLSVEQKQNITEMLQAGKYTLSSTSEAAAKKIYKGMALADVKAFEQLFKAHKCVTNKSSQVLDYERKMIMRAFG